MPRKIFTAGEVLAAADVNTFLMDQSVMTFAGTAARGSAIGTATEGMLTYLEDTNSFEFYNGTAFAPLSSGSAVPVIEYLVVAGGGGGGDGTSGFPGGGGGAGGYLNSVAGETSGGTVSAELPVGVVVGTNYAVQVGAGGAVNTNGSNSFFYRPIAIGGGAGGLGETAPGTGFAGGSGGGGGSKAGIARAAGAGTTNQGFAGGSGFSSSSDAGICAGGGGGAGQIGENGGVDGTGHGGDGGNGLSSSITGTAVSRGGGGGGSSNQVAVGTGGTGGGGDGCRTGGPAIQATSGTVNTGGGGGGGQTVSSTPPGAGGSGVVILRYASTFTITVGAGLTGTTSTVGDKKVTIITAGTGNVSWAA
jgi:hypothetical protein